MRTAIISDIHGNLEALESVILSIQEEHEVREIVCLGDIIGYGANPVECLDRCRAVSETFVIGNHDRAALDESKLQTFNAVAAQAAVWTREAIRKKDVNFLNSIPYIRSSPGAFYVHASPNEPEVWHYLFNKWGADSHFDHFQQPVCFVGHTHIPVVIPMNGRPNKDQGIVRLDRNDRYIVNVGSVGQPRDHDPRAAYGIYDDASREFQLVRGEYDIEKAAQKIRDAGLPDLLADRLFRGV